MVKLFAPKSTASDLCIDYPELKDYKEFNRLTPRQVKFAYYCGCRSSPHKELSPKNKYKAALRDSGLKEELTESQLDNYETGIFDDAIIEAIDKMATFRVSERLRMVFVNELMFDMAVETVIKNKQDLEAITDAKKRGEIISLNSDIRKELPELRKALEDRQGILQEEEKEGEAKGNKFMDEILT